MLMRLPRVGRRASRGPRLRWLCLLVPLAGCLPDPLPVDGQQLYQGRGVETLGIATVAGQPHVTFDLRRQLAAAGQGGVVDLAVVPIDGSAPARIVVRSRSDAFPIHSDGTGARYVVREERDLLVADQKFRVGTLSRFDNEHGLLGDVTRVAGYGVSPAGEGQRYLWYQAPVATPMGTAAVEYRVRDEGGQERVLRDVAGSLQFVLNTKGFYFTAAPDRVLYFVPSLDAVAQPLRAGVARVSIGGDTAIMVVPEDLADPKNPRSVNVVFDIPRRAERRLPGERICCWLGFEGNEFVYSEGAAAGVPAKLRRFDIVTARETVIEMPSGLSDVSRIIGRPGTAESLLVDSLGRVALLRPGEGAPPAAPSVRRLDISSDPMRYVDGLRFTQDGTRLFYVDVDRTDSEQEGLLKMLDGDLTGTPRVVSPLGTKLRATQYFFLQDSGPTGERGDDRWLVAFWARFGRSASDLYFADFVDLAPVRVAEAIRDVSVTPTQVLGILRTSQQDLVGDLVTREIATGVERLVARSVDSFEAFRSDDDQPGTRLIFYLRNRAPTAMDGIWSSFLPDLTDLTGLSD